MLFSGTNSSLFGPAKGKRKVWVSQMKAFAKSFKTQILLGNKVYTAINTWATLQAICSSGTWKNLLFFF